MNVKEICDQISKFDGAIVQSVNTSINAYGNTSGQIVVLCYGDCNLPKSLLDQATSVIENVSIEPISIYGRMEAISATSLTTYEITFPYNTYFIYTLKDAYEREEWRKANTEMDAFIEEWLTNE